MTRTYPTAAPVERAYLVAAELKGSPASRYAFTSRNPLAGQPLNRLANG